MTDILEHLMPFNQEGFLHFPFLKFPFWSSDDLICEVGAKKRPDRPV